MDDQAWPFLIGRTRTQDHRIVVIPDFMAAGALPSALRLSVGSGDLPGSPESVQIREIESSPNDRITVIYRVNMAHADDWSLPGERVLTDEQGRPILLTEGLVICRPATAVRQDGITQKDLDLAHSLVVPPYLEFWAQGADYTRQAAKSFALATSGKPVSVNPLNSPVPSVSAPPDAPRQPEAVVSPGTKPTEDISADVETCMPAESDVPVPAAPALPVATGRHRQRTGRTTAIAIGAAIAVIAIAVLVIIRLLQGPAPAGSASDPERAMAALCSALQSGDPVRGYAMTTGAYQHQTTEQKFAAELLPLGTNTAIHCSYHLRANPGSATAGATMTTAEKNQAHSWQVTLIKANGSAWQVSTIR